MAVEIGTHCDSRPSTTNPAASKWSLLASLLANRNNVRERAKPCTTDQVHASTVDHVTSYLLILNTYFLILVLLNTVVVAINVSFEKQINIKYW